MPRDVAVAHPRAEEVSTAAAVAGAVTPTVRRIDAPATAGGAPVTHLLSNGRYAVMLTADRRRLQPLARHRRDALARRPDPRRLGLVHLPARQAERPFWSAGAQPAGREADHEEVVFGEDHAQFIRRDGVADNHDGRAGLRRG